ncbi:hypothetical protein SLS62_003800 [Diatrype stigma]|uniref:Protein kinase domain-containing protein n=1 Tax=Diatrype stigma TaxID=117547 RepID=A0AAN9V644_9PEZI
MAALPMGLAQMLAVADDEDATGRRSAAAADELVRHFQHQYRFTFEGLIGRGVFGATFRIVEKLQHGASRRLAVKRALEPYGYRSLRREITMLQYLRGSAHIANLVAWRDDPAPVNIRGLRRLRRFVHRGYEGAAQAALVGLANPVMVLEYLSNGDMGRLYDRALAHNILLPNRVLWSFFLCSMLGDEGGKFPEHAEVPIVKLIDFGQATVPQGFGNGSPENIYRAARIIVNLICRRGEGGDVTTHWQGRETRAGRILPDAAGNNPFPTLDPWLRDLLAECMAREWHRRPDLRTAIERAEIGARMPPAAYTFPPGALARETPEYIRAVLKTLVYDADPNA